MAKSDNPGDHERVARSESKDWTVLLLCGASGIGKSTLARAIGMHYDVPVTTGDDIVNGVMAMTGQETHPVLHRWDTDLATRSWSPRQISELHLQAAEVLQPAFAAVIDDHLDAGTRTVLEGDYLLPSLASGQDGRVVGIMLIEKDTTSLESNYGAREPGEDHAVRSEVSVLLGDAFTRMAIEAWMPLVSARPWNTAVARVEAALTSG
jgi:2-phosphoglycerate kinase